MDNALREAHAQCRGFQLRRVDFPGTYIQRKLDTAIQELKNNAEEFRQTSARVREQTKTEVKFKLNDAEQVEEEAKALAQLVKDRANNTAIETKQAARTEGLKCAFCSRVVMPECTV